MLQKDADLLIGEKRGCCEALVCSSCCFFSCAAVTGAGESCCFAAHRGKSDTDAPAPGVEEDSH